MESSGIADVTRNLVEMAVLGVAVLAVIVILVAILFGTCRYIFHFLSRVPESYDLWLLKIPKARKALEFWEMAP
jgi:hypothetical protein